MVFSYFSTDDDFYAKNSCSFEQEFFEFCSISVLHLDDMARADVGAMSALYALGNIYASQTVLDDYRVSRALALALHAADAAFVTDLHYGSALIAAGACDENVLIVRNELDDLLRAGINTCAAADTLFAVDLCNAVNYAHCAELAGICTVAEADAGETAVHVALAAKQHCSLAVLGSLVVETLGSMAFGARAGNECDHLFHVACGNSHDLCDLCSGLGACGNALIDRSLALCDRGGIAVTAGEAAAAAVCAGQALTNLLLLGVNFDVEYLRCKRKDRTEYRAENTENDNTVNY